jgi:hypothetical protein
MNRPITVMELSALLIAYQPLKCWQFRKYLGSMLTLDFGDEINIRPAEPTPLEVGVFLIGIRNVYWQATNGEGVIADAESVDDRIFAERLAMLPVGAALTELKAVDGNRWIVFQFDNGFALKVDRTNIWRTDMIMFEITLPDGRIACLNELAQLELTDEIEPLRAERWERLKN